MGNTSSQITGPEQSQAGRHRGSHLPPREPAGLSQKLTAGARVLTPPATAPDLKDLSDDAQSDPRLDEDEDSGVEEVSTPNQANWEETPTSERQSTPDQASVRDCPSPTPTQPSGLSGHPRLAQLDGAFDEPIVGGMDVASVISTSPASEKSRKRKKLTPEERQEKENRRRIRAERRARKKSRELQRAVLKSQTSAAASLPEDLLNVSPGAKKQTASHASPTSARDSPDDPGTQLRQEAMRAYETSMDPAAENGDQEEQKHSSRWMATNATPSRKNNKRSRSALADESPQQQTQTESPATESRKPRRSKKRARSSSPHEDVVISPPEGTVEGLNPKKKRSKKSKKAVLGEDEAPAVAPSKRASFYISPEYPGQGVFTASEAELVNTIVERYREEHNLNEVAFKEMMQAKNSDRPTLSEIFTRIEDELPNRDRRSIRRFCQRRYNNYHRGPWDAEQDQDLREAYVEKPNNWKYIGDLLGRMPEDCRDRWRDHVSLSDRAGGIWTDEEEQEFRDVVSMVFDRMRQDEPSYQEIEDHELAEYINWKLVSEMMDGKRSRLQCRYKWYKLQGRKVREAQEAAGERPKRRKSTAKKAKTPNQKSRKVKSAERITSDDDREVDREHRASLTPAGDESAEIYDLPQSDPPVQDREASDHGEVPDDRIEQHQVAPPPSPPPPPALAEARAPQQNLGRRRGTRRRRQITPAHSNGRGRTNNWGKRPEEVDWTPGDMYLMLDDMLQVYYRTSDILTSWEEFEIAMNFFEPSPYYRPADRLHVYFEICKAQGFDRDLRLNMMDCVKYLERTYPLYQLSKTTHGTTHYNGFDFQGRDIHPAPAAMKTPGGTETERNRVLSDRTPAPQDISPRRWKSGTSSSVEANDGFQSGSDDEAHPDGSSDRGGISAEDGAIEVGDVNAPDDNAHVHTFSRPYISRLSGPDANANDQCFDPHDSVDNQQKATIAEQQKRLKRFLTERFEAGEISKQEARDIFHGTREELLKTERVNDWRDKSQDKYFQAAKLAPEDRYSDRVPNHRIHAHRKASVELIGSEGAAQASPERLNEDLRDGSADSQSSLPPVGFDAHDDGLGTVEASYDLAQVEDVDEAFESEAAVGDSYPLPGHDQSQPRSIHQARKHRQGSPVVYVSPRKAQRPYSPHSSPPVSPPASRLSGSPNIAALRSPELGSSPAQISTPEVSPMASRKDSAWRSVSSKRRPTTYGRSDRRRYQRISGKLPRKVRSPSPKSDNNDVSTLPPRRARDDSPPIPKEAQPACSLVTSNPMSPYTTVAARRRRSQASASSSRSARYLPSVRSASKSAAPKAVASHRAGLQAGRGLELSDDRISSQDVEVIPARRISAGGGAGGAGDVLAAFGRFGSKNEKGRSPVAAGWMRDYEGAEDMVGESDGEDYKRPLRREVWDGIADERVGVYGSDGDD